VSGLTPGSNTLTATAVDAAGVSGKRSVTVTYQPAARAGGLSGRDGREATSPRSPHPRS
jgi:hypothetical protein